ASGAITCRMMDGGRSGSWIGSASDENGGDYRGIPMGTARQGARAPARPRDAGSMERGNGGDDGGSAEGGRARTARADPDPDAGATGRADPARMARRGGGGRAIPMGPVGN